MRQTILVSSLLAASLTPFGALAWPFRRGGLTVQPGADVAKHETKVPLALGVMSKCPDARVCQNVFDGVLDRVGSLVDLRMIYIGTLNASDTRFGATCMHGESECLGNVQQLCVRRHSDQHAAWRYIQCVNYGPLSAIGNEDDARRCSKLVGLDFDDQIKPCVDGTRGPALLRESIRDAQYLHIKRSCSILIDEKIVCVHDGVWKRCDNGHTVGDFTSAIRKAYDRLNKD